MVLVSVGDVSASFEEDFSEDTAERVSDLIRRAQVWLYPHIGDAEEWVRAGVEAGDTTRVERFREVVVSMVQRVLRAPGVFREESDGAYRYVIDPEAASLTLRVTPEEWSLLLASRDTPSPYGARRLRLAPELGWHNSVGGRRW